MKFICTFCWMPHSPPAWHRMIGESGRMACEICFNAILDLSICWVCGEIIVRGEDVVSLGWCFWHKACFGCILCLQPLPLEGFLYGIPNCGDGVLELEGPPLCTFCNGVNEEQEHTNIVCKGLKSVSRRDGGLSVDRYVRNAERQIADDLDLADNASTKTAIESLLQERGTSITQPRKTSQKNLDYDDGQFKGRAQIFRSRETKPTGIPDETKHNKVALKRSKAEKRLPPYLGEDGNADVVFMTPCLDDVDGDSESSLPSSRASHTIYISIQHPFTEMAFRPRPTKPIPKWMDFLPGNRDRDMQRLSTEAEAGYPVSAEFQKPNEDDILDDDSDRTHDVRVLSASAPYRFSGTPSFSPKLSRTSPEFELNKKSFLEGLEAVSKPLERSHKTRCLLTKDIEREQESSAYLTISRRRTRGEDSRTRPAIDTLYPAKIEDTKRPGVWLRKARYVPPDESGWKGRLRDRYKKRSGSGGGNTNTTIVAVTATTPPAPMAEPSIATVLALQTMKDLDDRMAEVRNELVELFGEAD